MKKRKRIEALEQRVGGVLNVEAHEKSHLRRINDLEVEVHLLMHFREEALRRIDALEAAPSADPAVARAQNELGQMLIDKTLAEKGHPGRSCAEAQERIRELRAELLEKAWTRP